MQSLRVSVQGTEQGAEMEDIIRPLRCAVSASTVGMRMLFQAKQMWFVHASSVLEALVRSSVLGAGDPEGSRTQLLPLDCSQTPDRSS